MAAWYCLIGEKEYGPFSSERIQSLVEKGKLTRDHFVRSSTDSQWTAASELPGLFPAETTKAPVPPKAVPAKAVPAKAVPAKAKPPESPPPAKAKPPVASAAKKPPMAVALPPATEEPEIPSALPVAAPVATPVAAPASLPVGTPVAPAAAAVPSSEPSETIPRGRRKSKQQQYLIAGGLAAVLIVLGGVAIAVLGRSPGEEPGDDEVASSNDPQAKTDVPAPEDVEADPDAETDPDIKEPAGKTPSVKKAAASPSITEWLDASRKQRIFRIASNHMVRFHVVNVWLDSSQPGSPTLTVEVALTNASSKETLDYRSWTTARQGAIDTTVFLVDDKGKRLTASSSPGQPGATVPASRRLESQESANERLVFDAPTAEYQFLRLALPYAAIGRTGHVGFEIPRVMVKDRPPDSEDPVAEVQAPVVTKPAPDPTVAKPDMADPSPPSGDQFTIDQLRDSIKGSFSDSEETNPKPGAPPSKTSGQPKPFDGPRLKVERDDRMEEGPKKE